MARPLRIKYEGAVYHITARGNERKRIFFAASDYTKFKEFLREAQEKGVRSALDSSKKGVFNLHDLTNEKALNLLMIHKKGHVATSGK